MKDNFFSLFIKKVFLFKAKNNNLKTSCFQLMVAMQMFVLKIGSPK